MPASLMRQPKAAAPVESPALPPALQDSTSLFSIERVVTLLTPTVFAPLAALLTKLIAVNLPILHVTTSQVEGLEIAAFLSAVAIAWKWLHGRQLFKQAQADFLKMYGYVDHLDPAIVDDLKQEIASLEQQLTQSAKPMARLEVPAPPPVVVQPVVHVHLPDAASEAADPENEPQPDLGTAAGDLASVSEDETVQPEEQVADLAGQLSDDEIEMPDDDAPAPVSSAVIAPPMTAGVPPQLGGSYSGGTAGSSTEMREANL